MQKFQRSLSCDVWRCQECSFDNSILLNKCEMCQTIPQKLQNKNKQIEKVQKVQIKQKKDILLCPQTKCNTQNDINEIKCKKCGKFLIQQLNEDEQDQQYSIKQYKKEQMIRCQKCLFQNNSDNITCVNCDVKIKKKRLPRKTKHYPPLAKGPNYCLICNTYKYNIVGSSQMQCLCEPDDKRQILKTFCTYCFTDVQPRKYDQHVFTCKQKQIFYDKVKNKSYDRCTPLQIQTMIYMHKKSQEFHFNKQNKLIQKIQRLGYTTKDLQNLYHYIVNYAPIIIHMHADTHMQFFIKDTHYRSQFQTSKSSGSLSRTARTGWQDRMFDKMHHNAADYQRVKYGTMNFTNDPHGVSACIGYGQSYFLLKPHVRDRCTMTDMDSSSASSTICTFRFCYHLLNKLSDIQIKAAFEGSKALQIKSAGIIGVYKQIQIHGPVQFKQDIQRVYIHKAQLAKNNQAQSMIKQFCKNNDLDYQIFGEIPKPFAPIGPYGAPTSIFGAPSAPGLMMFHSHGGLGLISGPGSGFSYGSSYSYGMFGVPLPKPSYKKPPITYTSVSFPYSSHKQKNQKDEDYI